MGAAFPLIVHHFSWRHAWYFLGIGAMVMVVVNGLLLKSDPENSAYLPWGQKDEPSRISRADAKTNTKAGSLSIVFKNSRF